MIRLTSTLLLGLGLILPALAEESPKQDASKPKFIRTADCVYVPTPNDVVEKMLEMAELKKSDLLYDPGCGDGRIAVLAAKKYGCKAVGFEIDPKRIEDAQRNIAKRKVEQLVKIEQKDIFKLDLSPATVLGIYLLPEMLVRMKPQFERLKPGTRIVAHDYYIEGIKADKTVTMTSNEDNVKHTIYLYTAPLKNDDGTQ